MVLLLPNKTFSCLDKNNYNIKLTLHSHGIPGLQVSYDVLSNDARFNELWWFWT